MNTVLTAKIFNYSKESNFLFYSLLISYEELDIHAQKSFLLFNLLNKIFLIFFTTLNNLQPYIFFL